MALVWESIVLVAAGMLLLRVAGRKTISQITIAQTVVMISIGSLIIQPLVETSVLKTLVVAAIFIGFLVFTEYLELKFDVVEKLLSGQAIVVVREGVPVEENMRKLRFTTDKLELRLRQQGITSIGDVKTATLEANGQLGYELMRHAKPVTMGEMERILSRLTHGASGQNVNIFDEITQGHPNKPVPKHLL
jgi:uncharacterized membrane protein YcaP (DUF421 family)